MGRSIDRLQDFALDCATGALVAQLHHDANLNAAAGYVVDPKLPAPEALEDEWSVQMAPEGSRECVMAGMDERPFGVVTDPSEAVAYEETRVRPYYERTFDVADPKGGTLRLRAGLGWSLRDRVYVVFHQWEGP